jgi:hypothetical protein
MLRLAKEVSKSRHQQFMFLVTFEVLLVLQVICPFWIRCRG